MRPGDGRFGRLAPFLAANQDMVLTKDPLLWRKCYDCVCLFYRVFILVIILYYFAIL